MLLCLPCLFCHVQLVRSGQLIQMGLEHGLHLISGRGGQGGCGLLSKGHSSGGWGDPPDRRGGNPFFLFLQLILHALVEICLHRHGRSPTIALIPEGKCMFTTQMLRLHIAWARAISCYFCYWLISTYFYYLVFSQLSTNEFIWKYQKHLMDLKNKELGGLITTTENDNLLI